MMRQRLLGPLLRCGLAIGLVAGCSSSAPPGGADASRGGGGPEGGSAAPGGGAGGNASGGSGGIAAVAVDAAAVTAMADGGVDAPADAAVAGPDAAPVATDFKCTELVGLGSTREWYESGFEKVVVDARWQIRWHHRGYVEDWADVKNPYWGMYCDG